QPDLHLADIAQHDVVDGDRHQAFELDRRRIVVLQTLPNTRQVMEDRDTELGQTLARSNAGQHKQLRRVDRAAAKDDLAPGTGGNHPTVLAEYHTCGAAPVE